ncbi:hypothetical protein LCGC14_2747160 [marine sediment metagenome]|uniref:Uncharacterized protein n=1 Tax=marine sediment metagenome TaxID=412755 RepID=A0A0F8Z2Y0_9ZZZZ
MTSEICAVSENTTSIKRFKMTEKEWIMEGMVEEIYNLFFILCSLKGRHGGLRDRACPQETEATR